eukprot:9466192-Pyramimonas_sp.AAC.1
MRRRKRRRLRMRMRRRRRRRRSRRRTSVARLARPACSWKVVGPLVLGKMEDQCNPKTYQRC